MARYYRRRYTRVVKPKKRWASNIATYSDTPAILNQQGFGYTTLVSNSVQSSSPTPSIVKTGNFKVSIDSYLQYGGGQVAGTAVVQFFVVYVPEGWSTSNLNNLVSAHPEWILGSKTVGSSYTTGTFLSLETINLSTRLKRNLNSGDAIFLLFQIDPTLVSGSNTALKLSGHVRYWTCAN